MEPQLETVTEEPKITETVTKVPRERSDAQKIALAKAREKAMLVRSQNAELRKKQRAIEAAEKERSKKEVEEKFEALQVKPTPEPKEEIEEEEEEVVQEKPKKKKVKRRVVVVQPETSSSEEEVEVQLPRKKKTKPEAPASWMMDRVYAHPGRYA